MYTGIELKVERCLSNLFDNYKEVKSQFSFEQFSSLMMNEQLNDYELSACSNEAFLLFINDTKECSVFDQISDYKRRKKSKFDEISNSLIGENTLDAEQLSKNFFPDDREYDIFLSHSHLNEDFAIVLAITLEKLGLKVFIDSCVWGYAGDLQKKIDDKYCRSTIGYDYDRVTQSSAHVHMMLNFALQSMIDRSELLIFLNTDESVPLKDYLDKDNKTYSPWIASELIFSSLVKTRLRKKRPLKAAAESMDSIYKSAPVRIAHKAKLDHLYSIGLPDFIHFVLMNIQSNAGYGEDFLDNLYVSYGIKDRP